MDWVANPEIWIGFFTLVALEIVLGIDNIIFISILAGKLPGRAARPGTQASGSRWPWSPASRCCWPLSWIVRLTAPLFEVLGQAISGRDLILILGGLFLLGKSDLRDPRQAGGRRQGTPAAKARAASFAAVIVQIMLLDIVFSLDSVITAVGHGRRSWAS